MSSSREQKVEKIVKLLEQVTSLSVVAQLLQEKNIPHSANSWSKMLDHRILPAVRKGALTIDDLMNLLGTVEEFGRQHVFLFRCSQPTAKKLIERKRIEKIVEDHGLSSVLNKPKLLEEPQASTISDIRIANQNLVIKIIETRTYREYVGEERDGPYVYRQYRESKERAVNIVQLSTTGLLELRIYSHRNTSRYSTEVQRIWNFVSNFIPNDGFNILSLGKAKTYFWRHKTELSNKLRYSGSTLRNNDGTVLSASTGARNDSLYEDIGARQSVDVFLKHGAHCDTSNVWWLKQESGPPKENIHVLLSGEPNEFAVTRSCTQPDYEYVRDQIIKYNK